MEKLANLRPLYESGAQFALLKRTPRGSGKKNVNQSLVESSLTSSNINVLITCQEFVNKFNGTSVCIKPISALPLQPQHLGHR
jgi:hypothetical protein